MRGPLLPLTVLAVPLALAALLWVTRDAAARAWLLVAGSAVSLVLVVLQAVAVARHGPLSALGGELLVDGLAAAMALLVGVIAFACALFAAGYLPGVPLRDEHRRATLVQRTRTFQTLFAVLQSTLLWVVMTNNIVLLWVALEATTLASALLVSFYWDGRAIEAGYKYLLLLTVGITGAFFGCVLLYASAAPLLGSSSALLISNLRTVADRLPPDVAVLAAVLLLIGFGTKAGLVPFHPWVADAYAESPAVMSAFLGGVISKVPFVGVVRVWQVLAPAHPELNALLLWLGVVTIVVGGFLALVQDELKRMHAYSSVAQYGYVAVALGTGTTFGLYAAVLFMVSHALTKALLFFAAGSVVYATHGVRSMTALGGLGRRLPVTAACSLAGALSLAGLPPFSGFVGKAAVVLAAALAGAWVPMAVALAMSLVTMAYMIGMTQRVFRGAPPADLDLAAVHDVPAAMRAAMIILVLAMLCVGLAPQLLDPLLRIAAGA
jgi:hydrogenase-4 component F